MIAAATHYLSNLSNGKLVLWCYLIWWGAAVFHHFDPSPSIWLVSVGISWYQCSYWRSTDSQRWRIQGYNAGSLANLSPVRHALLRVEFFISYQGKRLHSCFSTIALRIGYCGGPLRGFCGNSYRA
jgi:hypothetical protein